MHSKDLLDVIFLLGSFPVMKIYYIARSTRETKDVVLLLEALDIPKKKKNEKKKKRRTNNPFIIPRRL